METLIKKGIKRLISVRYIGSFSDEWVHFYESKEIDKGRLTFKFRNHRLRYVLFSYL